MNPTTSTSPGASFTITEERPASDRLCVVVRGSMDLFAAPELKRRLLQAIDAGVAAIVLDLSETDFLDSSGLGALLTAHRRLAGRDGFLIVVPGRPSVTRVFEITGLDSIFAFAPTREQALALAGARGADARP